jgi:hypothetical protein
MDNHEKYAAAFNRWMDDFVNRPDEYESMEKSALDHLRERMNGKTPTYGERCAAVFTAYLAAP